MNKKNAKEKKWLLKKNKGRKQLVKIYLKTWKKKKVRRKPRKRKFKQRKKLLMKMLHKSDKTYVGGE